MTPWDKTVSTCRPSSPAVSVLLRPVQSIISFFPSPKEVKNHSVIYKKKQGFKVKSAKSRTVCIRKIMFLSFLFFFLKCHDPSDSSWDPWWGPDPEVRHHSPIPLSATPPVNVCALQVGKIILLKCHLLLWKKRQNHKSHKSYTHTNCKQRNQPMICMNGTRFEEINKIFLCKFENGWLRQTWVIMHGCISLLLWKACALFCILRKVRNKKDYI